MAQRARQAHGFSRYHLSELPSFHLQVASTGHWFWVLAAPESQGRIGRSHFSSVIGLPLKPGTATESDKNIANIADLAKTIRIAKSPPICSFAQIDNDSSTTDRTNLAHHDSTPGSARPSSVRFRFKAETSRFFHQMMTPVMQSAVVIIPERKIRIFIGSPRNVPMCNATSHRVMIVPEGDFDSNQ